MLDRKQQTNGFYTQREFTRVSEQNAYRCPRCELLPYSGLSRGRQSYVYRAKPSQCASCSHKPACTPTTHRTLTVNSYEDGRCLAARFRATVSGHARRRAESDLLDHGVVPGEVHSRNESTGNPWFATATTVAEAKAAEAAGADAVVAQGMEAGGHRGAFEPDEAEHQIVGLMALLPQVVDAVKLPVIATGGIADARGVAAALILGASAVQIGTGLLRAPEAGTHSSYAARLGRTEAHETVITRAFSGRPGRSIATAYVRAALNGPASAPYPVQRGLTSAMRESAQKAGDVERMQLWAGQSAKLGRAEPAGEIVPQLWHDALGLLKHAATT